MTSYTYSNLPITVTCQQRHYSPGRSMHVEALPYSLFIREKLGGNGQACGNTK
jgi:hypothetical protein